MTTAVQPARNWIQGPSSDLLLFSFGWIAVLIPLLLLSDHISSIILMVLLFNYAHRHYTFALVYGDQEEFDKRKDVYTYLPFIAGMVTFLFVYFNAFSILLAISVLWTMLHSVSQKYGITRVYARKAGYGSGWIEKGLIFSWFYYLFLGLAEKEKATILSYRSGQAILTAVGDYLPLMTLASFIALAVASLFTVLYIRQEYLNRHQLSIAKNVYVLSILILYSLFHYSLIVGYIVFAFSHALEYIAFVNIFVKAKYIKKPNSGSIIARAVKNQWRNSTLFTVAIIAACFAGRQLDHHAFTIYIVGSSFLHFIYDALIWKVRQAEVGEPLGIKYAST